MTKPEFTSTQRDFFRELGASWEHEDRKLALLAVAESYERAFASKDRTRESLLPYAREAYRRRLKQKYGSIVVLFILITAAGAALEWAVERFLDWLFPESSATFDELKSVHVLQLQGHWRHGR